MNKYNIVKEGVKGNLSFDKLVFESAIKVSVNAVFSAADTKNQPVKVLYA